MKQPEFHNYIVQIPIEQGIMLIDFFSGNTVLLQNMHALEKDDISRLRQMGFLKGSENKQTELKKRWKKSFLDNASFSYMLDASHSLLPEIINYIDHDVESRKTPKLNLGIVLYDNLPYILSDILSGHLEKWKHTKCALALRFLDNDYFSSRQNYPEIYTFIYQMLSKGASVTLHITIQEPSDFIKCMPTMQKLTNDFNLLITPEIPLQPGSSAESFLPFVDVFFKYQLYALVHHVYVIPGGLTSAEVAFNCMRKIDYRFYDGFFDMIFRHNLDKFVRVVGGGVLRSIQSFIDTNFYLIPMLIRCRAGSLVIFKESSIICCAAKQRQAKSNLLDENICGYIGKEICRYQESQLLYGGLNKFNFATYGGICPHLSSERQTQNVKALLSSFFHHYFTQKGGDYN
ncbi:hypothetical protein [Anaerobranca gottschalkii]|uniref:Uncharacterized protein n=1 Tax=Anaerobranca gottschalkii DSM 13577 TaxID=1120990 RepID=A0A1I0CBY1_9FIRM|nr:hypothetical protein [Anaerobranca gottschalkii]SET17020.1 hypothetical protein SAMN03080614_10672 [Anaerobranca gottschalkii DSM 13577]